MRCFSKLKTLYRLQKLCQLIQNKVQLALFDMDGVLYDSMPNHARAWHESMSAYGIEMSEQEAYACEGMRGVEVIMQLARQQWGREITESEAEEMYRAKSAAYASMTAPTFVPGIMDVHAALRSLGIHIGVVTGSGQKTLLSRLASDFSATLTPGLIVSAHDVRRGKPAPDPYLQGISKACQLLGKEILPEQTIVVENAPLGVRSAVAAGCFTIAVNTGPLPDEALRNEGAAMVLHDMKSLTAAILSA
ncbi:MAG: HAD-IA family hydrolase [Prevotella sp.]|nr:HAD-IA family hydrolase [Prevotella sp.]